MDFWQGDDYVISIILSYTHNYFFPSTQMSLSDVSCKVRKGSLVAVVGMVGSGKSSLLSAVLGDMRRCSGSVCVEGSVAYVPQQAWIQNLTVKDNILFGSEYEDGFYSEVGTTIGFPP